MQIDQFSKSQLTHDKTVPESGVVTSRDPL